MKEEFSITTTNFDQVLDTLKAFQYKENIMIHIELKIYAKES